MTNQNNSEQQPAETPPAKDAAAQGTANAGGIPLAIEVLVKKASIDPDFRNLLLERRADAARQIDLELTPAEEQMLTNIPQPQLEAIIANTKVDPRNRHVFLGKVGKLMLAAVGVAVALAVITPALGHQADLPPRPRSTPSDQTQNRESRTNATDPNESHDFREPCVD